MKVVVIIIQLLTCINIIKASVTNFVSNGDPIIGQNHQLTCTVDSFAYNVYIYKSSTETFDPNYHELVCSRNVCVPGGSGVYTGTVDGVAITIEITPLTMEEKKYWICKQATSIFKLFLNVYSVPSSITLKGPTPICDLGQSSCEFTCTTDECAYPSPAFTWLYVFDNGTTMDIPQRGSVSERSGHCAKSMKIYEDTLTFSQYKLFPGNTQTTVNLQCYITFSGLSSGELTSGLSQNVTFAVKVSAVQIFDESTKLTDNTFTVNEHEAKLLNCIPGNGHPTPTVQWFIGDTLLSTESQFRFAPVNSYHDRQLYCVADNIPDNIRDVVSNRPVLYVKVKIKFVYIDPAADTVISVIEDKPEPVLCITSAGRPGATIKWYKNDVELDVGDSTYFEKADDKLNVTKSMRHFKVSRSDSSWTLSCSASNFDGPTTIRANNSKQLTVLYPPERMGIMLNGKPVVGPEVDVIKGTPGTLTCTASSNPPVSVFMWNINQKVGDNFTIDDNIQNGQTINCTARNIMTSTFGINLKGFGSISKIINLQYGALIERIEVNGNEGPTWVIKEKDPVVIACYVDSNPDSTISLFQGGDLLMEKQQSAVLIYNLSSAECSHTDQYTCRAGNGITNVEQPAVKAVQINVECSPRLADNTDLTIFAEENATHVLSVTVLAYPIPERHEWYKNVSNRWETLSNTTSIQKTHASLQFNLTFISVKPADYGEYKLTVDNTIGDPINFTFVLKVQDDTEPHIDKPDAPSSALAGIIGGVVGGGIFLVCLIVIVICILRQRNSLDDIKTKLFGRKSSDSREAMQPQEIGYSYAAVQKPKEGTALTIIDNTSTETKLYGESTPASGYLYSEVNKRDKDNPMTIVQDKNASELNGGKNKAKKTKAAPETNNEGPCYENPTVLTESDAKAKPQKKRKPAKQKDKKPSDDGLQYVELSFSGTKTKGKKNKTPQPRADERTVYDAVQFGVVGEAYTNSGEENNSKN